MIPQSDAFYATLKKNYLKHHKHYIFPQSLAISIPPFANWWWTVNFSRHLPVSEWNTASLHGRTLKILPPPNEASTEANEPRKHPPGSRGWHPASHLGSQNGCVPKASFNTPFQEHSGKAPTSLFFNKKEFQAIPHIPSLKTPLRYTRHGQRSLMVSIIRHNVCAVLVDTEYNVTKEGQSQRMPAIKGSLTMFPIELHQHACEWQS